MQLCSEVHILVSYTVIFKKMSCELVSSCFGFFTKCRHYVFRNQYQCIKYLCILLPLIRRVWVKIILTRINLSPSVTPDKGKINTKSPLHFLLYLANIVTNFHVLVKFSQAANRGILKNFAKYTRKHLCWCWSLFLIKLPATLLNRVKHSCFPVTFGKLLRTFFTEDLWATISKYFERFRISLCGCFTKTLCGGVLFPEVAGLKLSEFLLKKFHW